MTSAAEGTFSDLPKAKSLPKEKKSFFKELRDYVALARKEALMPQATAARLMGISRQAVGDLVSRGRIREFRLEQGVMVSGHDVIAYWLEQHDGKAVPFHGTQGRGKDLGQAARGFKDAIKEYKAKEKK
ncbi:MAG: helix-turn-helix domain-containing protein [Chthoniobacterales bacterium]